MRAHIEKNETRTLNPTDTVLQDSITIIENLKKTLADEYILQLKTQNAHWNIEGPCFFSLHKLFEEQYKHLTKLIDRNAEVIRAMRSYCPGSFKEFKELASLQEFSSEKFRDKQFIQVLSQDHTNLALALKARLELAEDSEETSGVILYEDLISFHEKAAWMIRSHGI